MKRIAMVAHTGFARRMCQGRQTNAHRYIRRGRRRRSGGEDSAGGMSSGSSMSSGSNMSGTSMSGGVSTSAAGGTGGASGGAMQQHDGHGLGRELEHERGSTRAARARARWQQEHDREAGELDRSGATDSTGHSTLGKTSTTLSPTSGAHDTAKGDTLSKHADIRIRSS